MLADKIPFQRTLTHKKGATEATTMKRERKNVRNLNFNWPVTLKCQITRMKKTMSVAKILNDLPQIFEKKLKF